LPTKFQSVRTLAPADVIYKLVEVLDGELRRLGIRPDLNTIATQIQQGKIGEGIQPRILKVSIRQGVEITIEAHTEFIEDRRGESMVFADSKEMVTEGFYGVERRQIRSRVNLI